MKNLAILILLSLFFSISTVAQNRDNKSKQLVHMVFFKPKSEAAKQRLIKSLETFKTVDVIKNVQIGLWEDTNNPKGLLSEYSVVLQLTFTNLAGFRVYEKHPVHLASIKDTKDLMASPPLGYDYYLNEEWYPSWGAIMKADRQNSQREEEASGFLWELEGVGELG